MKIHSSKVLIRPRVTEKAAMKGEAENVFVFEVSKKATKNDVKEAVFSVWKVNPTKINIVNLPDKKVVVRGKAGVKSGVAKAYVYLKKGDKIELS